MICWFLILDERKGKESLINDKLSACTLMCDSRGKPISINLYRAIMQHTSLNQIVIQPPLQEVTGNIEEYI